MNMLKEGLLNQLKTPEVKDVSIDVPDFSKLSSLDADLAEEYYKEVQSMPVRIKYVILNKADLVYEKEGEQKYDIDNKNSVKSFLTNPPEVGKEMKMITEGRLFKSAKIKSIKDVGDNSWLVETGSGKFILDEVSREEKIKSSEVVEQLENNGKQNEEEYIVKELNMSPEKFFKKPPEKNYLSLVPRGEHLSVGEPNQNSESLNLDEIKANDSNYIIEEIDMTGDEFMAEKKVSVEQAVPDYTVEELDMSLEDFRNLNTEAQDSSLEQKNVSEEDDSVYTDIDGETNQKPEETLENNRTEDLATEETEDYEPSVLKPNPDRVLRQETEANNAEALEKEEYLEKKREFKEAERKLHKILKEGPALSEVIAGFRGSNSGPNSMEVARAEFNQVNKNFLEYQRNSGYFEYLQSKIVDRHNGSKAVKEGKSEKISKEDVSLNSAIADRHVLRPAEKRLELQTRKISIENETYKKAKQYCLKKLSENPRIAQGLGHLVTGAKYGLLSLGAWFNAPGVIAGMAARKIGNVFVNRAESSQEGVKQDILDRFDSGDFNLNSLEYDQALKKTLTTKRINNVATIGAAILAGTNPDLQDMAEGVKGSIREKISNALNTTTDNIQTSPIGFNGQFATPSIAPESVADVFSSETPGALPEIPAVENYQIPESEMLPDFVASESGVETVKNIESHTIKDGDNMSKIFSEAINKNNINLPDNFNIYRELPEFTNAQYIEPRFTSQEWIDMGVDSGNPQLIQPGETIDIQMLLEKMNLTNEIGPGGLPEIPAIDNYQIPENEMLPDFVPAEYVPTESGFETVNNVSSESGFEQTPSAELSRADLPEAVVQADTETLKKYFSEQYVMGEDFDNLRQGLAKSLLTESKMGIFDLPPEVMEKLQANPDFIYNLVDRTFPELSGNPGFLDTITGGNDTLTAVEWQSLGIESGDPTNISDGSAVSVGELKKMILEKISNDYDFHNNDELLKRVSEVQDNAGQNSVFSADSDFQRLAQAEMENRGAAIEEIAKNNNLEIVTEELKAEVPEAKPTEPTPSVTPTETTPSEKPTEAKSTETKPKITKVDVNETIEKVRRVANNPEWEATRQVGKTVEESTGISRRATDEAIRAAERVAKGADLTTEVLRQIGIRKPW